MSQLVMAESYTSSLQHFQPHLTVRAQLFASLKSNTPSRRDSSVGRILHSDNRVECEKLSVGYPALETYSASAHTLLSHQDNENISHACNSSNSAAVGSDSMIQVNTCFVHYYNM